jgi:hypothetical protein
MHDLLATIVKRYNDVHSKEEQNKEKKRQIFQLLQVRSIYISTNLEAENDCK